MEKEYNATIHYPFVSFWEMVKNDLRPFIKNQEEMEIWTTEYFMQLVDLIRS